VDIAYIIGGTPTDSSAFMAFLTFFGEAAMVVRYSGGSVLPKDAWPMSTASAASTLSASIDSQDDGDEIAERNKEIAKRSLGILLEQRILEALEHDHTGSGDVNVNLQSASSSLSVPVKIESAISTLLKESKRLGDAEADKRIWSKYADILAVVQVIHVLFCVNAHSWDEQEGKRALEACLKLQFALKKKSYGHSLYAEVRYHTMHHLYMKPSLCRMTCNVMYLIADLTPVTPIPSLYYPSLILQITDVISLIESLWSD
jgi:hypothetical protein